MLSLPNQGFWVYPKGSKTILVGAHPKIDPGGRTFPSLMRVENTRGQRASRQVNIGIPVWILAGASLNSYYEVLQVVPLRVNVVGEGLLPLQEPLKPKEVEAPAGIEPL
jgi:hypothetical protein